MKLTRTKTTEFILKIKQFRFAFITTPGVLECTNINQSYAYTFNGIQLDDAFYRGLIKKAFDDFDFEVETNLSQLNIKEQREGYLLNLLNQLLDCQDIIKRNNIFFHDYYEKKILYHYAKIQGNNCNGALIKDERNLHIEKENAEDYGIISTYSEGDFFEITEPVDYNWNVSYKDDYESMIDVHNEYIQKALKKICEISELKGSAAEDDDPSSINPPTKTDTTKEAVERLLATMTEQRPNGQGAILTAEKFDLLVNTYCAYITDKETPKNPQRFLYNGTAPEFYGILRNLHDTLKIPFTGIGRALNPILRSHKNIDKDEGLSEAYITKAIKTGGK